MAASKKLLVKVTKDEQLDILVAVAHFLSDDVKNILREQGIDIKTESRKVK